MKQFLFFIFILCIGCQSSSPPTEQAIENLPPLVSISSDSIQPFFQKENITGCFILYDLKNDYFSIYNEPRANTRFRPASTFKIPNSMFALETGVVENEVQMFKWDGEKKFLKIWERDHNLRSGIKNSVVWLYQQIARDIGEKRMQTWVDSIGYGNQNIGGDIDKFWLTGDIKISPKEQIELLKKIHLEELPFSKRTMTIFKDIMTLEKTSDYIYRGKTGWDSASDPDVGWFVGYVERNDNAYFFANNMEFSDNKLANNRKGIVEDILKKLELID